MKQTLMALRAAGVLLAIWAILAGIAFAAGVLPPFGGAGDDVAVNGDVEDAETDGGTDADAPSDGDAGVDAPADADALEVGESETALTPPTFTICGADTPAVSLSALEVVGDPRPEVAIGCGARVHVFAFSDDEEIPTPVRVATFDATEGAGAAVQATLEAGAVAGMDIDGDGLGDLVLPFRGLTAEGDTRGGALHLLRRNSMGSFEAPVLLAPIASTNVVVAQLDGRPGFEILATNRGSDLARRPSEVWVFTGGAAPARASILRAGVGPVSVAVADLDRDGSDDAVVIAPSTGQVRIHFGDGTAHFPRTTDVPLADATEIVAGDVDGDGGEDVLVRSAGLHLLAAGPPESLSPRPIDAAASLHAISLRDLDGDRKRDIVGIDGQRLVWLQQGDDVTFTEETLATIEGAVLRHYALADVDGDGRTDLVAIGRAPEEGSPWSLTVVPNVREADSVAFEPRGAGATADAPLMLTIRLR